MAFAQQDVRVAEALPAGTNNIGDVDIASALPAGANSIGTVSLDAALPAGTNNIGDVDIASALPAGANSIGTVGIDTALPAGTNNIGDVDIASALPAGTNNIGDVDIASALPAGTNVIGEVGIDTNANTIQISQTGTENGVSVVDPLPAGTNNIGSVSISTSGTITEDFEETASITKNQGSTETNQSTPITDTVVGTLMSVTVDARVGMTYVVNADNAGAKTVLWKGYIAGTGGQETIYFENVAKNKLTGNAGGTVLFDVTFTNDDKNQDATASSLIKFFEP